MAWKEVGKEIQGGALIGSSDALTRALGAVFGTTMIGYGIIGRLRGWVGVSLGRALGYIGRWRDRVLTRRRGDLSPVSTYS